MGYRPKHPAGEHAHRSLEPCARCIFDLEVELGYKQYPPSPLFEDQRPIPSEMDRA